MPIACRETITQPTCAKQSETAAEAYASCHSPSGASLSPRSLECKHEQPLECFSRPCFPASCMLYARKAPPLRRLRPCRLRTHFMRERLCKVRQNCVSRRACPSRARKSRVREPPCEARHGALVSLASLMQD
eukprot:6208619-Pleurochrysis_carterae.AAC.1